MYKVYLRYISRYIQTLFTGTKRDAIFNVHLPPP